MLSGDRTPHLTYTIVKVDVLLSSNPCLKRKEEVCDLVTNERGDTNLCSDGFGVELVLAGVPSGAAKKEVWRA